MAVSEKFRYDNVKKKFINSIKGYELLTEEKIIKIQKLN